MHWLGKNQMIFRRAPGFSISVDEMVDGQISSPIYTLASIYPHPSQSPLLYKLVDTHHPITKAEIPNPAPSASIPILRRGRQLGTRKTKLLLKRKRDQLSSSSSSERENSVTSPALRKHKAHPGAGPFKRKGLEHFGELSTIFCKSTATGRLSCASTQGPLTLDDERELEEDFMNGTWGVTNWDDDDERDVGIENTKSGSKRKSSGTPSGRGKKKMFMMDGALEAVTKAFTAKATRYEGATTKGEGSTPRVEDFSPS